MYSWFIDLYVPCTGDNPFKTLPIFMHDCVSRTRTRHGTTIKRHPIHYDNVFFFKQSGGCLHPGYLHRVRNTIYDLAGVLPSDPPHAEVCDRLLRRHLQRRLNIERRHGSMTGMSGSHG